MSDLLRATGLWKRISQAGNEYFSGRLGAMRVVILPNRERQNDSEPSHYLFFAEAEERPKPVDWQGPEPQRQAATRRRSAPRSSGRPTAGVPLPEDTVSDLWPEGKP